MIVVLQAPPAIDRLGSNALLAHDADAGDLASAAQSAVAAVTAVAAEQAPLRARITALGVPVLSAYTVVANGFLVAAGPADIDRLAALPGVAEVIPAPDHRLALADAAPHIGADAVAAALGFDGEGVTIGIIDTGIDYLHAAFGGPGTAAAYGGDDHALVEEGTFPSAKVVGGYDFAGSAYNGSGAPVADEDPIDENGHGTHVAGIAAAAAWGGRHGGVAPGAHLVALKVFGAGGSTNLAYDAIEWAVQAKLGLAVPGRAADIDVLNLSLGSAWASTSTFEQLLIDRAVAAGIVVVGAAGNDGDVAFVTGGPGMAPSAIGVASSVGPGQLGDRVQAIVDGVVWDIEAIESHASLAVRTAAIGRLQGQAIWLGRGCDGDAQPGGVAGRIAVLDRGACPFGEKLARAAAAGAAAALVADNGGGLVPMGSDGPPVGIPAYMIGAAAGQQLRAAIDAGAAVEIRFDAAFNGRFPRASVVDTVSDFSSRGVTRSGTFKPDIAAPGSGIRAPAIGTGSRVATLSGTSMAAPMIAGSAAVVIGALAAAGYPLQGAPGSGGVTPQDVRSVLTSTAYTDVHRVDASALGVAPFALRGAGRVALADAVRARALLRPAGAGSALSFPAVAAAEAWSGSAPFELRNLTDTPRRFALSVVASGPGEASGGVRFAPAENVLMVGPNGTSSSRLLVEIVPALLDRYALRGGDSAMNGDGRLEEAERDAYLVAAEIDENGTALQGGDTVRLPIWAFARGASDMAAPEVVVVPPGAVSATIDLSNSGAQPGRAEAFIHLATDAIETSPAWPLNAVHVGARVAGSGADRRIEIAVVFAGPSLAPFDLAVEASLDTDRNGSVDRVLTVDDASVVTDGAPWTGTLRTVATDARGRGARDVGPADVDVNSRIVVLSAGALELGFPDDAAIALDLAVEATARFGGARVDSVPDGALRSGRLVGPLSFAPSAQWVGIDTPEGEVAPGGQDVVHVHRGDGGGAIDGVRLLLLFPDDPPGEGDSQVVAFRVAVPATPTERPEPPSPSPTQVAVPPGSATLPPLATPVATPSASETAMPTAPPPTPSPSAAATDEPTRAPRLPTVVLPVEPTATATIEPQIESTPSPPEPTARTGPTWTVPAPTAPMPTAAPSLPMRIRAFLPFAYRYVRRPRP